jgi:hypothetical protein
MSNTRIITALVAFVATFIFSAGLVRIIFPAPVVKYVYTERYTERPRAVERSSNDIESFLLRDISNGETRLDYTHTDDYADAVMKYWKTSSSMDASAFPQDFQSAWSKHMQAWGDYANYLQDRKASKNSSSNGGDKRYNAEINRTWEEVLRIGRTYGSNVR